MAISSPVHGLKLTVDFSGEYHRFTIYERKPRQTADRRRPFHDRVLNHAVMDLVAEKVGQKKLNLRKISTESRL